MKLSCPGTARAAWLVGAIASLAVLVSTPAALASSHREAPLVREDAVADDTDFYMFRDLVPLPKGTRLDSEIHWDNSAENPHNPASPPVRVQWGEESRDEMGSISLLVVPQAEADLAVLKGDIDRRQLAIAIERMARDPALAQRVREFLKE